MSASARGPIARRLLVVAGIAAAGWLLGAAGPAHADTSAGPAGMAPGMERPVLGTVSDVAATTPAPAVERPEAGSSGRRFGTTPDLILVPALETGAPFAPATAEASVPGASSLRKVSGGLAGSLREAERALPVHPSTVLDAPGLARAVDIDLASIGPWPGSAGADLSWTPRHRHGAKAGTGDRTGVRTPGPLAVSGASKGGRATFGAAFSYPAPIPGAELPQPLAAPAHVRPSVGPTLTGAGIAHLAGPGALARPSRVPAPPSCVVAPAVHSAADEPSCSPD
ncbi:hypothetical protein [Actinomadura sp. HBU206391]|uniref:hypothetical protein n=1 Tax=Actinomadura sp. HBU206391 TaxID=2731692 RepID=UPI001650B461|nr:hypothetical protein [Actinomadura sp. HBU206391]MBC6458473.1 hypothetical protein [Actinomadura sp. HBU206391]